MKKPNKSLKNIIAATCFAGLMFAFPTPSGAESNTLSKTNNTVLKDKYLEIIQKLQVGLEDNYLDIAEQDSISLDNSYLRTYGRLFTPNLDVVIHDGGLYEQTARLANLVERNVNGIDWGQPELEKELHARGLPEVEVERHTSGLERVLYGLFGTFAVTGSLVSYVRSKRKA